MHTFIWSPFFMQFGIQEELLLNFLGTVPNFIDFLYKMVEWWFKCICRSKLCAGKGPFWKIRSHNYVKCNEIDLDSSTIKRIKNMENNDSTVWAKTLPFTIEVLSYLSGYCYLCGVKPSQNFTLQKLNLFKITNLLVSTVARNNRSCNLIV